MTIRFAHMIDLVLLVLGELSAFRTQRTVQVPIISSDGTVLEIVVTDVADHLMLQDTLSLGAPLSITFRPGPPFKDTPGFIWMIHGEKGDIRIIAPGPALQANDEGTDSTFHTFDEELELIGWVRLFKSLPLPTPNVAAMYEAHANANREDKYPDLGHAVRTHKYIEEVYKSAEDVRRSSDIMSLVKCTPRSELNRQQTLVADLRLSLHNKPNSDHDDCTSR